MLWIKLSLRTRDSTIIHFQYQVQWYVTLSPCVQRLGTFRGRHGRFMAPRIRRRGPPASLINHNQLRNYFDG